MIGSGGTSRTCVCTVSETDRDAGNPHLNKKDYMNYECHITCKLEDHVEAEKIAKWHGWKTSEIARDPLLGQDTYFYLTRHHDDLIEMHKEMNFMSGCLRNAGCTVIREKIELTVYDTKSGTQ